MKYDHMQFAFSVFILIASSACAKPPEVAMLVHVLDEAGVPVEGARVVGRFYWPEDKLVPAPTGITDSKGEFILRGNTIQRVTAEAEKEGYYPSKKSTTVPYPGSEQQPYPGGRADFKVTLTLREIRDPVPMYAGRIQANFPEKRGRFGYDLLERDWVAPHGSGNRADVYITIEFEYESRRDHDLNMTWDFVGKGNGIQDFNPMLSSQFISPYEAPQHGYATSRSWRRASSPESGLLINEVDGNVIIRDAKHFYVFRIRGELDEQGEVHGGYFGKIYGSGFFWVGVEPGETGGFRTGFLYLNPREGDHNLEMDLNRNLRNDFKHLDRPRDP